MDSRQRFVLIFALISMSSIIVFAFLNTIDFGLYVSAIAIIYFALRLILNPKIRLGFDALGFLLLALFVYYVAERVITILK